MKISVHYAIVGPVAVLALAACASAPSPRVHPTNENVTHVIESAGADQVIYIRNGSSIPIVVTSLVIAQCENVSTPCDSVNPNIEVRPGQKRRVARVQPKHSKSRPRFQFRYLWRAPATAASVDPRGTIPGPESAELLARATGTIVMSLPLGRLQFVSIPSRENRVVDRERWHPQSLDGPDSLGFIALATDSTGWTEHELRLRHPDGREEVLLRRNGGILWHHAIGPIALAPVGGRIAFVRKQDDNVNNYAPLGVGPVEVWEPETRTVRQLPIKGLEQKPSWFPDGRRLAVAAPVGQTHNVFAVDVTTDERADLGVGDFPVVSTDGRTLLAHRGGAFVELVDVATRTSKPITLPGNLGPPLALIRSRYVVYRGLPTEGMPRDTTVNNSPLVGPKPTQTIKLVDLENGHFVTLIDVVDPRLAVSVSLRVR
jgi:hypothetical protein